VRPVTGRQRVEQDVGDAPHGREGVAGIVAVERGVPADLSRTGPAAGLSPRTVRYLATIVHGVLGQAVKDGLLARNPTDAAMPPTAREAKAPEMRPWTAGQLAAFSCLRWAESNSQNVTLWTVLAMTGMRRGEALSLRWRDFDPTRAPLPYAAPSGWSASSARAPRRSRTTPRAASLA
jgi:integrase